MVNAFEECRSIEARSFEILRAWFDTHTDDGRYVLTDKGRLARFVQQTMGDVILQRHGAMWCVEVKAEQQKSQNFFLEQWSNLKPAEGYYTQGWMSKLDSDLLLYHFIDADELWVIAFPRLQQWAYYATSWNTPGGRGRLYDYPLKPQGRHTQKNKTWGRCVPIADLIADGVPVKLFHPSDASGEDVPTPAQLSLIG